VGSFNVVSGNATAWAYTDPIFVVGNGSTASSPSNALTVLKNGNVGIGQTNPTNMLEVNGSAKINAQLDVYGTSGIINSYSNYGVLISDTDGLDVRAGIGNYTTGAVPVAIRDDSGINIANYAGTVGLRLLPDGTIEAPSGIVEMKFTDSGITHTGTFLNSLTTNGWLYSTGASLNGNLSVYGSIYNTGSNYSGRVYIGDTLEVSSSTYLDGYTNIVGNLNINNTIYNTLGNVQINDTLDVFGWIYPTSGVSTSGTIYTGYLNSSGGIHAQTNLTATGNVGAGTTSPSARVHGTGSTYGVRGDGSGSGGYFRDSEGTSYSYLGYGSYGVYGAGDYAGGYFYDQTNSSGAYATVGFDVRGIWANGSFAGGTFSDTDNGTWVDAAQGLYSIRGNGRVSGTVWETYSDIRLKDIIANYSLGLEEFVQLSPVRFRYKEKNALNIDSSDIYVGLIAQEVEKIVPDAVVEGEDGILSLDYNTLLMSAINAIKELKSEKDSEVAELKAELAELKALVCELKPTAVQCEQ
jgi:hypothetical protein